MLSLYVLLAVFVLIAVRQLSRIRYRIWHVMLLGALAVLITGQISLRDALAAINPDVMLFLFGVFVVGRSLEESGYLSHLSFKLFRRARSMDSLLLAVLVCAGLASALLMNDTLAIIGTPVVLLLARKHAAPEKVLLLALAFGVTIGSVMSPIGNPQNLLIALESGMDAPFVTFLTYLFVPTALNLLVAYAFLRLTFRGHFKERELTHTQEPIRDARLARIARLALGVLVGLILLKIALVFLGISLPLTLIALVPAGIVLSLHRGRAKLALEIDWETLVFFASMFVLMESVWLTGIFQGMLASFVERSGADLLSLPAILGISVALSQLISNVPLVALYLPVLLEKGISTAGLMALAAGSTIAGNLLVLGAASNVIIIQNAERRGSPGITFLDFAKAGIPLTALNVAVYWLWLAVV